MIFSGHYQKIKSWTVAGQGDLAVPRPLLAIQALAVALEVSFSVMAIALPLLPNYFHDPGQS